MTTDGPDETAVLLSESDVSTSFVQALVADDIDGANPSPPATTTAPTAPWPLVRPPRRSEGVLEALEDMILTGRFRAGDRLPTERELADRFGVGRNTVREAIRQLSLLGLVDAQQGGGTFVLDASAAALIRPFRNVARFGGATADKIMEFRAMFEPTVAALAAMRRDETQLGELEATLDDFETAARERRPEALEHDTRFHHLLAEATGNPMIAAIGSALMELLRAFRQQALEKVGYEPDDPATRGHREVLVAIRDGDGPGAAAAMRHHIEATLRHLRHQ